MKTKRRRNIARKARTIVKNPPLAPSATSKLTEPEGRVPTAQAEGLGTPSREARPSQPPIASNTPSPQDCHTAPPRPPNHQSLTPSPFFHPGPDAAEDRAPGFVPPSNPAAPANINAHIFESESKPSSLSPQPHVGATGDRAHRNRQNAAHSTGPRTPEGKGASSQNAVKHGLSITHHVILEHEDPALFAQLQHELREIFAPQSPRESLAVEDIAECRWTLRRFDEAETALLDYHFARASAPDLEADERSTPAEALAYSCILDHREPAPLELPSLQLLLRYRRHWERRHKDALAELDRAQRARRADAQAQRQQEQDHRQQELHRLRITRASEKLNRASGFVPSSNQAVNANVIPQSPEPEPKPQSLSPNPGAAASRAPGFVPSSSNESLPGVTGTRANTAHEMAA